MSEEQVKYEGQPKYTPGPWKFTYTPPPMDGSQFDHMPYCRIHGGPGYWDGKNGFEFTAIANEADARLIAAAPEMLASLETLLEEIDFEIEQRRDSGNDEDWADLQKKSDRAHAAIGKAKGEAQ